MMIAHSYFTRLLLTTSLACLTVPALAQDESQDQTPDEELEEIIVTGAVTSRASEDMSQRATALGGEALDHARRATLGATLDQLPGMSVASFGPAIGRPVIRGLGGDRIRILIGGIGSIDASSTSPDHATAADTATAERIEVLRGPSTLLYGNNAVGGVVNIFDGRIPTRRTGETDARVNARFGTNGNEKDISGWLTTPLGTNQALHLDASLLDRTDMTVPGAGGQGNVKVSNTYLTRYKAAAGFTHFLESGFIGASVSYLNREYGLPGEVENNDAQTDAALDEQPPFITLDQLRVDVMGQYDLDTAAIDRLDFRFGFGDYEHAEEEDGVVASIFTNRGWEARLAASKQGAALSYAFGLQARYRDFGSAGEETFVPDSITNQGGVFGVFYYDLDSWLFEAGGRLEYQKVTTDSTGLSRQFWTTSFSASAVKRLSDTWRASLMGFRTSRAPNAEEMLSFGPHLVTGSFEIGDPALGQETASGLELGVNKNEGPLTFGASFFYTYYENFIYERFTGHSQEGLPVATFNASDARFWGVELEGGIALFENTDHAVHLHLSGDYVNATDVGREQAMPRIPPLSLNAGLDYNSQKLDATLQLTWADSQTRTAPGELPTDGNLKVDASVGYRPYGADHGLELYLQANNLFNNEIRTHTSYLKDRLPEPGRDIRAGFKMLF